jgi:hypothetical protein
MMRKYPKDSEYKALSFYFYILDAFNRIIIFLRFCIHKRVYFQLAHIIAFCAISQDNIQ